MATKNEQRKVTIIADGQRAEASIKQMRAAVALLNNEWQKLPKGSEGFKNKGAELQKLKTQLRDAQTEVRALDQGSKKFWTNFKTIAAGVVGGNLITGFMTQLKSLGRAMIQGRMNIEESVADVRKVTGLTNEELETLQKNLSQIDTRTGRSELLELAYTAGKLGMQGVDDVTGFVKAANQINVALGKDLGEDAVKQIGKLVSIFKLEGQFGIEKGMLKIASAINEIGMASTASEDFLVNFAQRLSGISGIAKLSAPDIIALGGTLDSLGQRAETSTTALSKLFVKMGQDTKTFAKFAKMDLQEFRELLQVNAVEAFKRVLEGVKDTSNGMEALTATLGELGLDGGRIVGILGSLANNTEEITRQQEIANRAFKDGVSVTDEYAIKNETLQAKFEKLSKVVRGFLINNPIAKALGNAISHWSKLAEKVEDNSRAMRDSYFRFRQLGSILTEGNLSLEARAKVIDEINRKYGTYLGNLIKEGDSLDVVREKLEAGNKAFMNKIKLMAMEDQIAELTKLAAEMASIELGAEIMLAETDMTNLENYQAYINQYGEMDEKVVKLNKSQQEFATNMQGLAREKMGELQKQIDKTKKAFESLGGIMEDVMMPGEGDAPDLFNSESDEKITSLLTKIRDLRTNLIEDLQAKEREVLANKLADELSGIDQMKAKESEKLEAKKLLNENYQRDLAELEKKQTKERNDADLKAHIELLAEYELTEQIYFAQRVEAGKMSKEEEAQALKELDIQILEKKKELHLKYGEDIQKIELDLAKARTDLQADSHRKQLANELAIQQHKMNAQMEGSRARLDEELALLDMEMQAEIDSTILTEEQKKIIEESYRADKLRAERAYQTAKMQQTMNHIGAVADIFSSLNQVSMNMNEKEHIQYTAQQEEKKARLEDRLAKGIISQEQYTRQMERLDKETREKEKAFKEEQYKKQRRADIISAGVRALMATLGALSAPPYWPANAPSVIMAGVAGAAGVAAVASKPIPQFYEGGLTSVKGAQDGRMYHARNVGTFAGGGVYDQPSLGLIGERGPELVIPNPIYTNPALANVMGALESMIYAKQYATGGVTAPAPNQDTVHSDVILKMMGKMMMSIDRLNNKLDKPIFAKTLWNQTEFDNYQDMEDLGNRKSAL